jgi:uncharacterized protein
MMISRRDILGAFAATPLLASCAEAAPQGSPLPATPRATKLISAARSQIGVTLSYDPAYTRLAFPGGDVPRNKGVCTDVVIRAYRDAFGVDFQALVNADMQKAFAAYPKRWGLKTTDRNIDHRRVPNLQTYLTRQSAGRSALADLASWQAGDIFTCLVGGSLPHIGIISDRKGSSGRPLIIHNIGAGTREEDALGDYKITGRYRWKVD